MCGIIACIGSDDAVNRVVTGLENLEYRGYDSAGIAVQNGNELIIRKQAGKVSDLVNSLVENVPQGPAGIGHTRWSTHGPPTDENAHPHTGRTDRVAAVHNGVISNYERLRETLKDQGHQFTSDTDTEVIPHLVERYLDEGLDSHEAFKRAVDRLEGSYAIALMVEGENAVHAARQGSPLVLGLYDGNYFLASDVPAFLEFTDTVVYLEDGDVLFVDETEATITDLDGAEHEREAETVDWDPEETGKGQYDHYMLKEIDAQPESLSNTIRGRIDPDEPAVRLDDFPPGSFEGITDVHLVACGTSYHAAMYGARLLEDSGIRARAILASEYAATIPIPEETLVIPVTQSGETADTLGALRAAKQAGARTLAVTNVFGSSAAREADEVLYIRAGPEIGVAATKTFSSQVATLALLVQRLAEDAAPAQARSGADLRSFLEALSVLPNQIEEVLRTSRAEGLSGAYRDREAYFFIGSGLQFPVALEGALKFKEITYEHAEGFASGELKHGPLALVTPGIPVFAVFAGDDGKTHTNAKEAQARGAEIVAIASEGANVSFADDHMLIPNTHPDLAGLLANVQLQLVSYYTARRLDRSIDKPRNLAKSVTVE